MEVHSIFSCSDGPPIIATTLYTHTHTRVRDVNDRINSDDPNELEHSSVCALGSVTFKSRWDYLCLFQRI